MFASEDMFADHDGPAKAAPPPPADEPEEWSASEDSDDALEESKGHTVTVTPPKRMAAGAEEEEDEWSDDDMEGSPQAVAPASETPRSSAAPPPTSGPAFVPTMGVGGYEWDGAQGVGVNPSRPVGDVLGAAPAAPAAAPQGQSAAAIRKAQLEQMKERERLKRLERIGGLAMASKESEQTVTSTLQSPLSQERNKEMTETEKSLQSQGVASVFDPTKDAPARNVTLGPAPVAEVDLSDIRSFVSRTCHQESGTVQCQIMREKSSMLNMLGSDRGHVYRLYLKDGMRFILGARKRKKSQTANYVISLEEEEMSKHSNTYIGKVRANFTGTEFTVYDKGISPSEAKNTAASPASPTLRQELVFCTYESNILGAKGPRKMHVLLPRVHENGDREEVRPTGDEEEGLRTIQEEPSTRHRTMLLHNKPPKWNDRVAAFVLNFNGRVTMASVKNFQLVLEQSPEEQRLAALSQEERTSAMARMTPFEREMALTAIEERVVLQFGKVGKDEFTMDYRWPMSPLQAFGICLGSLDNKLACE